MTFKQPLLWLPLLVASFFTHAASPFYQLELTALNKYAPKTMAYYQGQVLALMLVQPNCGWCKKQHKLLESLFNAQPIECRRFSVMMMATGAEKRQLERAMARYQTKFATVTLPNSLANSLESKSTPQVFLLDSNGNLATYHIGFMPEAALLAHLQTLTADAGCRISATKIS
ncbi:hypothetical protein N474_15875 [Pseudoalteromonas luteoviolacea CPMOR-2]|uniref:Thioredoxin-like fold domain-containing protein n=1 Tax=Pseudoalteromonas luteoviolacea DSM 6061 TaxID=1365250 RepID=A0A166XR35_9GAMM|nr:thioredoxin family protein [Pseudoalteromonas luteoviolacea]KZN40703.1 hypothetical protein N475_11280 [Pseudoalteromonas luteoviolacea DSM 6061]KZN55182.1 hypothetical protein N474_15875 [Pseudoalteromonas luteoviolacea CPMOR-2]MBE0387763.1 hypothetical protein [Pseudoalteromonas luteoviolacea DSM 6061]